MSRLRRIDPQRVDALVALAVFVAGTVQALFGRAIVGDRALNVLAAAAMSLVIALRRRGPFEASAALIALALVQTALLTPVPDTTIGLIPLVFVPYAAAAGEDLRRALAALAIVAVGAVVVTTMSGERAFGDFTFPAVVVLGSWLTGRMARQRVRLTAELHEQAVLAQERHAAEAQAAVTAERQRIARELHDVVAHSVSVMVVQAGGGRRILDQEPDRAVEAASQIERTGRAALVEMGHLLGVLRPADATAAVLAPQPSLAQLDALADSARAAGMPVHVRVEGTPRQLSPGLDLAAYRLIQEGLTNALKHGGGTPAEVRVCFGADALELEVTDRGPGPGGARRQGAAGGGHGLVGMQERVRLYGGTLETGRRRGGGFRVAATLPLEPLPAVDVPAVTLEPGEAARGHSPRVPA